MTALRRSIYTLTIAAFMLAGGAFIMPLSGIDPRLPSNLTTVDSSRSQLWIASAYGVLLLTSLPHLRRSITVGLRSWPLLALCALALLSAFWAPDAGLTLRRGAALSLGYLAAMTLVVRFSPLDAQKFVIRTLGACILASLAFVFLLPEYGIHQITDGFQSVHAGSWRGIFNHRTLLGRLSALCFAITLWFGGDAYERPALRWAIVFASLLCVVMSRSGGAIISVVILSASPPLIRAATSSLARAKVALLTLIAGGALIAVFGPSLINIILEALGKSSNLTGRVPLWNAILITANDRPILGYGYSSGFLIGVMPRVANALRTAFIPNAQSAYIDIYVSLGLVGLSILLFAIGRAISNNGRELLRRPPGYDISTYSPLLILIFCIEAGAIEAYLTSPNNLVTHLFAFAIASTSVFPLASSERKAGERRSGARQPLRRG